MVLQAECCPQCGEGFSSVQALISHSEAVHQPRSSRPQSRQHGAADSCPHCGKMFADAVALVHHAERCRGKAQCVLS